MNAIELPFYPPDFTDAEIGGWLVLAWWKCHGHRQIKLPHTLPAAWCKLLSAIHPVNESGSVAFAPLESALRRAIIDNDHAAAGRMVRAYIVQQVALHAIGPVFRTGLKVRKPMQEEREKRSRGAASDTDDWQRRANDLWAKPQHRSKSAFDIARLIDSTRANTIRRKIHRP